MPRIKGVCSNKRKDNKNIAEKNQIILESVKRFFKENPKKYSIFINILKDDHTLSIEDIEWFFKSYSKIKTTFVNGKLIQSKFVTASKQHSKKLFNPLKKGHGVVIQINDEKIQTSICQLNFFKWAFNIGLIDYLTKHTELRKPPKE